MVNEVESILNEIRERVRADHEPGSAVRDSLADPESARDYAAHQALSPSPKGSVESDLANNESLSRLSAHLTTTGRAWDRLPPMYSNRKGGAARIELWIKARLKSISRWFTWEQVNFNSAVHHALSETLQALSAYRQELSAYQQDLTGLRGQLSKEAENRRGEFERRDRELTTWRAGIEALTAEFRNRAAELIADSETRTAELASVMTKELDQTRAALTSRLAELAGELRESDQQLREEQRVCFKQLSLEESEAAVREDRGRRVIESRLDKLEKVLANGE